MKTRTGKQRRTRSAVQKKTKQSSCLSPFDARTKQDDNKKDPEEGEMCENHSLRKRKVSPEVDQSESEWQAPFHRYPIGLKITWYA
jgi:hypothetical protein